MISSGHIELGRGASPGFVFRRATANFAAVKSLKILIGVAVGVLQRSDTFFDTSRVDLRLAPLFFPFLMSCAAIIALAGTGQ